MRQNPLTSIGPWSATSCGETDRAGRIIERKRLTRRQMERFIDALEAGTEVVMEGCGTAHDWGSNSKPCRPCIGSARNGRPRCARINVMRGLLRASAKRDRQGRAAGPQLTPAVPRSSFWSGFWHTDRHTSRKTSMEKRKAPQIVAEPWVNGGADETRTRDLRRDRQKK